MSKCLALPPPLMYLHSQILLSGSKQSCLQPWMPHCFWKPPGEKRGRRDSSLPRAQKGTKGHTFHLPRDSVPTPHPTPGIAFFTQSLLFTQSRGQVLQMS